MWSRAGYGKIPANGCGFTDAGGNRFHCRAGVAIVSTQSRVMLAGPGMGMTMPIVAFLLLSLLFALPCWAQAGQRAAPALPAPPVDDNAPAGAFLRAAQSALIGNRLGEAQQALEMAQTRVLDRSVPLFQTNTPSSHPALAPLSAAVQAVIAGDREAAIRHIQAAMPFIDQPANR
jgi:hypothetical protein